MFDNKAWFLNDQHLASFWNYHRAAVRWVQAHKSARDYAVNGLSDISIPNDMESNFAARTSSNYSLPDVGEDLSSRGADEDIDMSTEMAAFFRQTIEHRKQRDANRSKEAKKNKESRCCKQDHYVMADKIGVYGSEFPSSQMPDTSADRQRKLLKMKKLYGSHTEKILAMETHLDLRFEQNYSQPNAHLWPNIPLKL
uniref:Gem-associated protein 8 n=1 Tax=Setaria digitata TaxID=48799 RepID=A0A915PG51_9BILA